MRARTWMAAWLAIVVGFSFVCSASTNELPEVQASFDYRGLVLRFAQPMQTWDNGQSEDLVVLSPALPTRCSWSSDTEMLCVVAAPQKPALATRYRLDFSQPLKTQQGVPLRLDAVFAETERPRLWPQVQGWKMGVPEVRISAPTGSSAAQVAEVLRLRIDGKDAPVPALAKADDYRTDQVQYALRVPPGDADRLLELSVVPGLQTAAGGLRGVQNQRLLRMQVEESFRLRGATCRGAETPVTSDTSRGVLKLGCLPGETVDLLFSSEPDAESRRRIERALPAGVAAIRWRANDSYWRRSQSGDDSILRRPGYSLSFSLDRPRSLASFALGDTLRAKEQSAALVPVQVELRLGDYRPRLRARHQRSLIAEAASVPALAESVNSDTMRLDVLALGARPARESLQTTPSRDNEARSLDSSATRTALDQQGWVAWAPESREPVADQYLPSYPELQFAAPGFDLYAVGGRREVLAWANEWNGQAPVAGAQVELLWWKQGDRQPQPVTTADTGADGVALLRLPDAFVLPEVDGEPPKGRWLLRAQAGKRRAVLPYQQGWGANLGQARQTMAWGVSDRPMYRAGDTVRYRLWQRDRDGARLRPVRSVPPATLRLYNQNEDRSVVEWQATPSADGGIEGQLQLPIHLTDATYCVGIGKDYDVKGACFFVGTYRAQDLWIKAKGRDGLLRDGDRMIIDLDAGYFSGGPAASVELSSLEVELRGLPLQEAYPDYAEYEFVDVEGADVEEPDLAGVDDIASMLDSKGHARIDLPVSFEGSEEEVAQRPAFGLLVARAEVAPEDREGTYSNDVELRYARFDSYVGLRLEPRWLDASTPVRATGVVIDAQGKPQARAPIEVTIEFLPGYADAFAKAEPMGRCRLQAGVPGDCDFPRLRSGRYRLTARSGKAAPAQIETYVWAGDTSAEEEVEETGLELRQPATGAPSSVQLVLRQPNERARVLLVVAAADKLLEHRLLEVAGKSALLDLALPADIPPGASITAYVRDAAASGAIDGYRTPPRFSSASVDLAIPERAPSVPLSLEFQAASAAPASTVVLVLRNETGTAREAVVSVMDDALRALAGRWLPYADPLGFDWLGGLRRNSGNRLEEFGFGDWNGNAWLLETQWIDTTQRERGGAVQSLPAAPEAPPIDIAEPRPADSYGLVGGNTLDSIMVTGSRIRRADLEAEPQVAPDPNLRRDSEPPASKLVDALARVRTRFADTALWRTGIRLAPGETRRIELALPDNLTRWRAVAWSNDEGDDFAMSEATLESGLPVETRLQLPVRIYPGDRARLAANVRQAGAQPAQAQAEIEVSGIGAPVVHAQSVSLAAGGQRSLATDVAPTTTGTLLVTAKAQTSAGRDAVAAPIEVASPTIAASKVQAGWLDRTALNLQLPALPEGATHPQLRVYLLRGAAGLSRQWTEDLRDYPHRCWEQILSRAVAAALAMERGDADWPAASEAIEEALDNAAVFQRRDGGFVYFAEASDYGMGNHRSQSNAALTAYSVRALELLGRLGHPVQARLLESANGYLEQVAGLAQRKTGNAAAVVRTDPETLTNAALAAGAGAKVSTQELDGLWANWNALALPGRIATARALALARHVAAPQAVVKLLDGAPARGSTRRLSAPQFDGRWMSSPLREQCALIELLGDYPALDPQNARRGLIAGLTDLYAGGVGAVDTQSGAVCLSALQSLARAARTETPAARFGTGANTVELRIASGQAEAHATLQPQTLHGQLEIQPLQSSAVPSSYVARLDYQEDARQAASTAVGFSLQRSHEVLRGGQWVDAHGQTVTEGDWIRITLVLETSAPRYFVALTDAVPGGLRPTDLLLGGVAGLDLEKVSSTGSPWFATRRLDPRNPRFYAEHLPAGRHEVHYFAKAGNAGDYLAAPALAELMYGTSSRARTAASRLSIVPSASAAP